MKKFGNFLENITKEKYLLENDRKKSFEIFFPGGQY
jgi:hypothetical protein